MKRLLTSAVLFLCCAAVSYAQFSGTVTDAQGVKYTANDDESTCYVSGHEQTYSATITIPDTYEGRGVTSIGSSAFSGCSGLTSLTIPEGVTSIGERTFSGCSGLTSLTLPEGVTSIGDGAFSGCSGLTSLTIPEGVTSIGDSAFFGCSNMTKVNISDVAAWCNINFGNDSSNPLSCAHHVYSNGQEIKYLVIPNSVTSISSYTFYSCYGLTSLTIPESVISIGRSAFNSCRGLTSLTILEGVTSIGRSAFNGCSGLTSLTIPESVTSIGEYAFRRCSGLTSLTIPEGVTSIGEGAFAGCSRSLTSIIVEDGNTKYDSRENCNAIIETYTSTLVTGCKTTVIPHSVTSIGDYAFWDCSGLTSLTIPEGVTSIGDYAFQHCSSLTSVYVKMETPPAITADVFSNRANATLYVPYGCSEAYAAAAYWQDFKEIVEFVDETDISEMDDAIYVEPTEVISGNQAVLSVKMKNNVAIQTIQFDLYLPEGVTVVPNEDQELITASKARINKFNYFNSTMQENGALRLLAQATTTNVPAGDGEICRVTVSVPESMDKGDYPIIFKDVLMVEANNTSHSPDPNVVQCKLTVLPYTPGDASFRAADFNNDGDVNAIDFNMVGNYILYGSSAPSSRATRKEETSDPQ